MKHFSFQPATVKVKDLKVHPLLEQFLGNVQVRDAYFETIKYYGHFEVPVITKNNEVLTHVADFLAAKELKRQTMDVIQCDLDESELPVFSVLKHLSATKSYTAIYDAIGFYTDYFKSNPTGIEWAKRIKGDMDKKLAFLFGYSDSQIKKIRSIGNKKYDELGLIQQGEKSFQQVFEEINTEESCNEATQASPEPIAPKDGGNRSQTASKYQYFTANITYAGGDQVEITVTEQWKRVTVNGKEISDLKHKFHGDDDKGKNTEAYSHVFCPQKTNNASYQIILENPAKFFNS